MQQTSPEVDKKPKQHDVAVTPARAEHIIAMKKADLGDPSQDDVELVAIAHPEMDRDARQSSLQNRERTCWMNALLHAMSAIPRLAQWILSHAHEHGHVTACALCALRSDVAHVRSAPQGSQIIPEIVISRRIWSHGHFAGPVDQDVMEAWMLLTAEFAECATQPTYGVFESFMCILSLIHI